jgi:DNA polymerase
MTDAMQIYSDWATLEEAIRRCTKCPLHRFRKNAVPGEGDKNSKVMFVGEAPGATEDEMGRPFVGAAGRLLTTMLESLGIKRESVYITNVVKCRPPGNREPNDEEIEVCKPYLISQITLLKPRIIVTLGNVAGKVIFSLAGKPWNGVTKMRGKTYKAKVLGLDVIIVPSLHPAAVLYNPQLRTLFENDLKTLKSVMDETLKEVDYTSTSQSVKEASKPKSKSILDYIKR